MASGHKIPLPREPGFSWIASAGMVGSYDGLGIRNNQTNPRDGVTAISGVRSLYCAPGSFSTVGTGKRAKRPDNPDPYGPNRPRVEPPRDHDVLEMTTKTTTDEDGREGPPGL